MENILIRRLFWIFNKLFMTPVYRLGLGALISNPVTGYIVLLKTIGNKSGKTRWTPVNYAIWKGNIYCLAGAGQAAHWYRNLIAHPEVDLILPRGAAAARAVEVKDLQEKTQAARRILKSGGLAGFSLGFNPFRADDERIASSIKNLPVMRMEPTGLASGPTDGGGWFWIVVWLGFVWWIFS